MNAVACTGLQLYHFGETVSIVFFTDTWRPDSFYDRVKVNRQNGQHTLCLLDIKVKEQLLEVEEKRQEGGNTPVLLRICNILIVE